MATTIQYAGDGMLERISQKAKLHMEVTNMNNKKHYIRNIVLSILLIAIIISIIFIAILVQNRNSNDGNLNVINNENSFRNDTSSNYMSDADVTNAYNAISKPDRTQNSASASNQSTVTTDIISEADKSTLRHMAENMVPIFAGTYSDIDYDAAKTYDKNMLNWRGDAGIPNESSDYYYMISKLGTDITHANDFTDSIELKSYDETNNIKNLKYKIQATTSDGKCWMIYDVKIESSGKIVFMTVEASYNQYWAGDKSES